MKKVICLLLLSVFVINASAQNTIVRRNNKASSTKKSTSTKHSTTKQVPQKKSLDFTIQINKTDVKDVDRKIICDVLTEYMDTFNVEVSEEDWFNNLKVLADKYKFTSDRKAYKANPDDFNGQTGDVAGFLRVCICGRKNTPNIYYVQKILGKEKVFERINSVLKSFDLQK